MPLLHKKRLYADPQDRKHYELFREAGVCVDYNVEKAHGQVTCSICSDGFRTHIGEKVSSICRALGGDEMFYHEFKGNGEAMRFAFESPLSAGFSERSNDDFWGAAKVKELVEVLGWAEEVGLQVVQHRLIHHWPCKAGTTRAISYPGSVDLVLRGKFRIKHQIKNLQVSIEQFIDWGPAECTHDQLKMDPYVNLLRSHTAFMRQYDDWLAYCEHVGKLPVLKILGKSTGERAAA